MVRTDLGRHVPRVRIAAMHAISVSARRGALPIVQLAAAAQRPTGGYYDGFTSTRSSPSSYDDA